MTNNSRAPLRPTAAATCLTALLLAAIGSAPVHAQAAPSVSNPQCGAIADPAARLACYDRANAAAPAPNAAQPSPRWPEFNTPPGPAASVKPQASPPAQALQQHRNLVAGVVSFNFSRSRRFTVTLDNGQVWRQLEADDGIAQFRDHDLNRVVISHGFWRSYDLRLNDMSVVFKVQRIK